MKRRNFVKDAVSGAAATAALYSAANIEGCKPFQGTESTDTSGREALSGHVYNGPYSGEYLNRPAFPLGGMGAGMICIEGTGALSHFSLRNEPDIFDEPCVFAAVCVKGDPNVARVLEGPVPRWKAFGNPDTGNGAGGKTYGLPRFASAEFQARFPFATVRLTDDKVPLEVQLVAWSTFTPGDADNSSLPAAALEYTFINKSQNALQAVFSFNSRNFMADVRKRSGESATKHRVRNIQGGFVLEEDSSPERPQDKGAFCAFAEDRETKVDCRWFRGGWWDPLTIAWKHVEQGAVIENPPFTEGQPSPGASLYVPFTLPAAGEKKITLLFTWYVPHSEMRLGVDPKAEKGKTCTGGECRTYKSWYAAKFADIDSLVKYWLENYPGLREKSASFRDSFYETTLQPEVVEAVAANLTILKSPTVMRQYDGKLWCWEGCSDKEGCCRGSCTHVWNYAQALPHLFPELERSLRDTEFFVDQDDKGHQNFRAFLPIRPTDHNFHAASDGQLGGIMKVHREWRISGDTGWLSRFWPKVKQSLDYCIETWDPGHKGVLEEPHHNTYDIEFWGPDGMCSSFYLGALKAASLMGKALGKDVSLYESLYGKGRHYLENELFNGEYFIQKVKWQGLRVKSPLEFKGGYIDYSPEAIELLKAEGPKYQYGTGCLSDGVLGAWIAEVCGIGEILDPEKVKSHLAAVHKYNFKKDLSEHPNPQRPSYALGREGGLLLCTWPKGGKPSLPFVYSDEVWTGIEYQVASHLATYGLVGQALEIVSALRDRYDGRVRNPFNEYECGHWYARAMASYGLFQGLAGVRYDAVEKILYLKPRVKGDFRCFLSTATGFGIAGVKGGKPFLEVRQGTIEVKSTEYTAFV